MSNFMPQEKRLTIRSVVLRRIAEHSSVQISAINREFQLRSALLYYLYASLRVYRVPEEKIQKAVAFTEQLDLSAIAQQTVQQMITSLELLSAA